MAILESLPQVKVSITSGGEELKEYEDIPEPEAQHDPNTIVKYVECKDGAAFEFKIEKAAAFENTSDSLKVECKIDGVFAARGFFAKRASMGEPETKCFDFTSSELEDGTITHRSFKFAELEIIPSDVLLDLDRTNAELTLLKGKAELTVNIHQADIKKDKPKPKSKSKTKSVQNEKPNKSRRSEAGEVVENPSVITEKASIPFGISHLAGWGESQVVTRPVKAAQKPAQTRAQKGNKPKEKEVIKYSCNNRPIATYIFRYRSKASLTKMLIILADPEPDVQSNADNKSVVEPSPLAETGTAQSTSTSKAGSMNIDDLSSEEMKLLISHNFEIKDVSMRQLQKLAEKKLNSLPLDKIKKILERDPDDQGSIELDELSLDEICLLAHHELRIQELPFYELRRIAEVRLEEMTAEEVKKAIRIQTTIKRELKQEDNADEAPAKRAKRSSKHTSSEVIELSD